MIGRGKIAQMPANRPLFSDCGGSNTSGKKNAGMSVVQTEARAYKVNMLSTQLPLSSARLTAQCIILSEDWAVLGLTKGIISYHFLNSWMCSQLHSGSPTCF